MYLTKIGVILKLKKKIVELIMAPKRPKHPRYHEHENITEKIGLLFTNILNKH